MSADLYLGAGAGTFWRWSADRQRVEWTDGVTIASLAEVRAALARMAASGLPAFSHVVMVLAACEPSWRTRVRSEGPLADHVATLLPRGRSAPALDERLREGLAALEALCALPYAFRESPARRALIAEVALERAERELEPRAADGVVAALPGGAVEGPGPEARDLLAMLDAVRAMLPELTAEKLERRARTGTGEPPDALDADPVAGEVVARLLDELEDDVALAAVARQARALAARLQLPRLAGERDPMPVGGHAELSHRGPLDRLLVSELAHDPDTLAARLALQEALYLGRELPARQPARKRLVLLDAGVRMWGTPRRLAAAVGLALAAAPGRRVTAFGVAGEVAIPLDLSRREGLDAWLEALHADPHPAGAVSALLAARRDPDEELALVTHASTLGDAGFRAGLPELGRRELFVCAVARGQPLAVVALGGRGARPVRTVELPIEPGPRGETAPDPVPVVLGVVPFPLRVPHEPVPRIACVSRRHGCAAVTRDGRLLHWSDPREGARVLAEGVPRARPASIHFDEDGTIRALFGTTLLSVRADGGEAVRRRLPARSGEVLAAGQAGALLWMVHRRGVEAFEPESGRPVPAPVMVPAGTVWVRGRFFRGGGGWPASHRMRSLRGALPPQGTPRRRHSDSCSSGWLALDHDGRALRLVAVGAADDALALFDREGLDGPWAIDAAGVVRSLATGERIDTGLGPARPIGVSRDGWRLAFALDGPEGEETHLYDLETGGARRFYDAAAYHLEPSVSRAAPRRVKHRFDAAVATGDGLALAGGDGRLWGLAVRGRRLVLAEQGRAWAAGRSPVPFARAAGPAGTRHRLRVARFSDGSRVYLDARGVLHLVPADPALPQLAVVLTEPAASAWSTAGRATGAAEALEIARRFAERLA